jgi:hypothetical protein
LCIIVIVILRVLLLLVLTTFEYPIHRFTNPNPVYKSLIYMRILYSNYIPILVSCVLQKCIFLVFVLVTLWKETQLIPKGSIYSDLAKASFTFYYKHTHKKKQRSKDQRFKGKLHEKCSV